MKYTIEDLINALNEFDNSTIVEEIVIQDDCIDIVTSDAYSCFDDDYIKSLR